jgi:hypothetical protein
MGNVIDEETGQEPTCIFCNSKNACSHLVAVIDRTFAECSGGALYKTIAKLRGLLSDIISGMVEAAADLDESVVDHELAALFREAVENYDSAYPDDIYIDEGMFLEWLVTALIDAGADEPPGYIVEEGGPGQSSALTLLYAENPKHVIQEVEKVLRAVRSTFKTSRPEANIDTADTEAPLTPRNSRAERFSRDTASAKKVPDRKMPGKRLRPVLIVVTDWPGGTMAFKFGGAMQAALDATQEEMTLVQMAPERIFRVETKVSEADFREAMASRDVTSGGSILFIEIPTN